MEDLLQEATIALWNNRDRLFSLSAGPRQAALIWKIARNAIIDDLRRTPYSDELPEGYDSADENHEKVNELLERIALLPEQDRMLVTMQLEGYSYDEIAQELGMTVKNVSVRLVRIKEKIRKEWT